MFRGLLFCCLLSWFFSSGQNTFLKNEENQEAIPFATISFGNGNGLFADGEGGFYFTQKLYKDIDTLYITALGFQEKKIPTLNLPKTILLSPEANMLKEVIVTSEKKGKFKVKTHKPTIHNDYFHCWLPTIESEVAVFFDNPEKKTKKITTVYIPINAEVKDWKKRKSSSAQKKTFSTLFRAQFYENDNGLPGEPMLSEELVFRVTQENDKAYELDVSDKRIYIPKTGVFVSVQVLGYTDAKGKLLPNKKYQEVKTKRGIVKVSTTFRPLLPFTNEIAGKKTFVKRVFLNGGKWVRYEKKNIQRSKLLLEGYNNYGIGLKYNEYLD